MEEMLARRATKSDAHLKVMIWGEAGAGKSRLALSFPSPIVADLERSTRLYAEQFDFWVAEPTPRLTPSRLVPALVKQIEAGCYPDRATLIIDPITDYLDGLEADLVEEFAKSGGTSLQALQGMAKNKAYGVIRDGMRARLDRILALPMNVVFVARAKNLWEQVDGKMKATGRQPDAKDWLEYLCDIVIYLRREGRDVIGDVRKSRLAELPGSIPAMTYADIKGALSAGCIHPDALEAYRDEALRASTMQP